MGTDLSIRCRCGTVRGVARDVSANAGNHGVCYCDDCQAFAHYLGNADTILDAHGGTEIFQMSPARLSFTAGVDRVACMKLTPKGLLRWYAACCRTPLGNTMATGQVAFVGLIHSCMDPAGRSLDEVLGPIRVRAMGKFATGDRSTLVASDRAPFAYIARMLGSVLAWRLRGDHRRSPFFDPRTLRPIASPTVLGGKPATP